MLMDKVKISQRSVVLSIILNTILAIGKGITGVLGNSYALIADAIESTTDIFASILVLIGVRYSAKPPDENHPYGHGRAEALFTFIVVGFLVVSATVIAFQAIINIQRPHETPEVFTLYVLGAVILFKEASYHYVNRQAKRLNSTVLRAEAWHHRSDAISSLFAFVGILIAVILGDGYEIADDIAALIASILILVNAYRIFRPALGEIMDEHVYQDLELEIRSIAEAVDGVKGIEKCFIRKTGMFYYVEIHVIVDANITVESGHLIGHNVKEEIRDNIDGIRDVHTHVEPHVYQIDL